MTAVTVKGVEALQRRLAAATPSEAIKDLLQREAETIAEGARESAPGQLGGTVEILDQSRGTKAAYAIGTAHRAGRFLEFGTVRRPATPWLWPVFRARSPGVKHRLAKLIGTAFKSRRGHV